MMIGNKYLLDANIIIKIWDRYPELLDNIEKSKDIEFKISKNIAAELSSKEYADFNGVPVLSEKFIKLLDHVVNNEPCNLSEEIKKKAKIKQGSNYNVYNIEGYKISSNDYSIICLCDNHREYKLVTDDKIMNRCAKIIMEPSRVLNLKEFIEEIHKYNLM